MRIFFSGTHRSGKTTLGMTLAAGMEMKFIPTNISDILKNHNVVNPFSAKHEFSLILERQRKIKDHIKNLITENDNAIFDRCIYDVDMYSVYYLGKVINKMPEYEKRYYSDVANNEMENDYIDNDEFMFIIQPGIEFVHDNNKLHESPSSQHFINSIFLTFVDHLPKDKYCVMPRSCINLQDRIAFCMDTIDRIGLK